MHSVEEPLMVLHFVQNTNARNKTKHRVCTRSPSISHNIEVHRSTEPTEPRSPPLPLPPPPPRHPSDRAHARTLLRRTGLSRTHAHTFTLYAQPRNQTAYRPGVLALSLSPLLNEIRMRMHSHFGRSPVPIEAAYTKQHNTQNLCHHQHKPSVRM